MKIEYGIMSCKWSIEAEEKLTAYAAILISQPKDAGMIVLYSEGCENDQWAFSDNMSERIGEIFGGKFSDFDLYVKNHVEEIRKAIHSIKTVL